MNKREFLALGGAVPLMLAGCGGSSSGSAPVRLVNASVGYQGPLGFMDESTQITSGITYGKASDYFNVEAGSVHLTLTTTVSGAETSATAAQLRTVNKGQRYSLVAYGILDELRMALVAELNTTPDAGTASVNVLNTSADIGAVDVYLSTSKDLSVSTQIASNVAATSTSPAQSPFATDIPPGSYYITVVGAGSIARNVSDVRFQTPAPVALSALQVLTVILTPGLSGVLANAILLTQGSTGTSVSYQNTTARARAVTAISGNTTTVVGATSGGTVVNVLSSNGAPQLSDYSVVATGAAPTVKVGGVAVPVVMDSTDATTGITTQVAASLTAGGDYTIMIFPDATSGAPVAKLIEDDNTAPLTAAGVKFRLINLAVDKPDSQLSMTVNGIGVAKLVPYGSASPKAFEVANVPQGADSTIDVTNGATTVIHRKQVVPLGNIFTDVVVSIPASGVGLDIFQSAAVSV
jgi:hypothetical protein